MTTTNAVDQVAAAVPVQAPPGASVVAETDVAVEPPPPRRKLLRVGTLTYTRGALLNVFFWMLWGDFCLNVMESVIPRMVPLQLEQLGASNALIGLLTGSVFSAITWITNPIISTWSDRHRGPLGRRMPFMLYPTPALAFFLIMVGFGSTIAGYLQAQFPGVASAVARTAAALLPEVGTLSGTAQLTIGVIAVMLVLYKVFDMFPQTVYYYLFSDVIPQEVMGKFTCLFRVFCTAGGFAFHYWLLQYATTYPRAIYLGCGLLYLVAFILLSLLVKEGQYPPPPPRQRNLLASLRSWLRESFAMGFYWKYFLTYACFRWAFVPFNTFLIVYAKKQLGMDPAEFGHAMAIVLAVQMPVLFLLGPIVDRFHPVRVCVAGYAMMLAAGLASFFFIRDTRTFFILTMGSFVALAVFQGALASLGPRLLPRERYGQFCAANSMVVEGGLLLLSWFCGLFLDTAGLDCIFIWVAFFSLMGIAAIAVLHHAWQRHGGDDRYVPPGGYESLT